MDGNQLVTVVIFLGALAVGIILTRFVGAWMLRINDVIKHTQRSADELTKIRKLYEGELRKKREEN